MRTRFIYKCETEDEVQALAAENHLNEADTAHAIWRWHNFITEDGYNREIVRQAQILHDQHEGGNTALVTPIPRKDDGKEDESQYYRPFSDIEYGEQKDEYRDHFKWDLRFDYSDKKVRYFDTKCTTIKENSKPFSEIRKEVIKQYKETQSVDFKTSASMVEKLYENQSKDKSARYGNGPRLFFWFISLRDGVSDVCLKRDEGARKEAIRQLFDSTDILTNSSFATIKHSLDNINKELTKRGWKQNTVSHVKAAIFYVIMDEDGVVHLIDGNK